MEGAPWRTAFDAKAKRTILAQLTEAEGFEAFCQKRYVTTKRFGLEGGEVIIPALHAIIETVVAAGVSEIVIGMPHRGRLNTLVDIVKKPLTAVFSEFGGESFKPDDVQGSGDVKYHLGFSTDRTIDGPAMHVSLAFNPSHLEAVDPVVVGRVRAKQAGDVEHGVGVGDARPRRRRVRRPGPRAETLQLSNLPRLSHRRHDPPHRQQPGRLHRVAGASALDAVLHRRREDARVPDLARQRRGPRCCCAARVSRASTARSSPPTS